MYKCQDCQETYRHLTFVCANCRSTNITKIEAPASTARTTKNGKPRGGVKTVATQPVTPARSLTPGTDFTVARTATCIDELDRVLGGGFVDNEVVLFGAVQGTGKSTLALQMCAAFTRQGLKALYCSAEETFEQIGARAARLGITSENLFVVATDSLEEVLGHFDAIQPDFFIMDSLQTVASEAVTGKTGSISQTNEAAHVLTARIKDTPGAKGVFINQVTKTEEFAGSNTVQHLVDCVLFFESSHDSPLKFLRAYKNRFGETSEVGIFRHTNTGLEQVPNPAEVFLTDEEYSSSPGAVFTVMSEGIRQIPLEVQALVVPSTLSNPRKQFNGVDHNTGQIVCAIVDKYCDAKLWENDAFVSTVFGLRLKDPLTNLGVAAAILSSATGRAPVEGTVFLGELTLTGHVRSAFDIEYKVKEAARMGFTHAVVPAAAQPVLKNMGTNMVFTYIDTVQEVLEVF